MHRNDYVRCYLDDFNLIIIESDVGINVFYLEYKNEIIPFPVIHHGSDYKIELPFDVDLSEELVAHINYKNIKTVEKRGVVLTKKFDEKFYSTLKMGAFVEGDKTIFNLWAPIATQVILMLNDEAHVLVHKQGVYSITFDKNLHLSEYYYLVSVNGRVERVVDPYAISSTLNAKKSVVIDEKTVLLDKVFKTKPNYDYNVCEINVSDFSNEKFDFDHPHKFLAIAEKGVKNQFGTSIGFDYLVDMQYDYVQLMPVYDFGSVNELIDHNDNNNWGYDPSQYFCTEGSYVSDKSPMTRITELRDIIQELKRSNIGVIMDVVFNHVYDSSTFSFNQITPMYFFRYDDNYNMLDGSYCGNEVASERKMVGKFISDCFYHFTNLYQMDGFRVDLMGLMDYNLMINIEKRLKKINPNLILFGEGWNLECGLHPDERCTQVNAQHVPNIGFFDDDFRNLVKGNNGNFEERGIVNLMEANHLIAKINSGVNINNDKSYTSTDQLVRYVSCHDDHTLYDYLRLVNENEDVLSDQIKSCYDYIFKTPGIKFIHIGCDFKRTKNGIQNTYNMSKNINMVDWDLLSRHYELNRYVKELIKNSKK